MRPHRLLIVAAIIASSCGGASPLESGATSPGSGGGGPDGGATPADVGGGPDGGATPADATYGYFYSDGIPGSIHAVPTGGGTPVLLITAGSGHEIGFVLAYDAVNVYYGDAIDDGTYNDTVMGTSLMALPIHGGTPRALVEGLQAPVAIAIDDQSVYFGEFNENTDDMGFIARVPKVGGTAEHLIELSGAQEVKGLAVDSGFLYWTQADGVIRRIPVSGGTPETLASGELNPFAIAVSSAGVYWLNDGTRSVDCGSTGGAVRQLAPSAGAPITVAANLTGAASLALGGGAVAWSTGGAFCPPVSVPGLGSVFELGAKNTIPRVRATGVTDPSNLFIGGATLYFTEDVDQSPVLAPVAMGL